MACERICLKARMNTTVFGVWFPWILFSTSRIPFGCVACWCLPVNWEHSSESEINLFHIGLAYILGTILVPDATVCLLILFAADFYFTGVEQKVCICVSAWSARRIGVGRCCVYASLCILFRVTLLCRKMYSITHAMVQEKQRSWNFLMGMEFKWPAFDIPCFISQGLDNLWWYYDLCPFFCDSSITWWHALKKWYNVFRWTWSGFEDFMSTNIAVYTTWLQRQQPPCICFCIHGT